MDDWPLGCQAENHRLLNLTPHHLTSLSQANRALLRKRKSHTVGILGTSQVGFVTPGDELLASGRLLVSSWDWIRQEPPRSGVSPTSTSGHPAPLLDWVLCPAWLAAASLWRFLIPPSTEKLSAFPTTSILSPTFLVFTTLPDMIVFAVVYCPSLPGNSFQRAGPQLSCSTLDLDTCTYPPMNSLRGKHGLCFQCSAW